jgi:anti-sigma factor RsiW
VQSTDQHAVKPWFNGRLDVAPPVADLAAEGFTLLGGRLDYINGRPVAALVYRRRVHVINLFVGPAAGFERVAADQVQGFNVRRWIWMGLSFWSVSDLNGEELKEFEERYRAVVQASGG